MTSPENNASQLSQAIEDNLLQLSDYIHRLSSDEHETTVDRFRLIHELGAAAYHLSLARDQLNLGTTEIDDRSQPTKLDDTEPKALSDLNSTVNSQATDSCESPTSIPEQLDLDVEKEVQSSNAWDQLPLFSVRELSVIKDMVEQHIENKWFRYSDYRLAEFVTLNPQTARVAWHRLQLKLLKENLMEATGLGPMRRFRVNQSALKAILELSKQETQVEQTIQITQLTDRQSDGNNIMSATLKASNVTLLSSQEITNSSEQPIPPAVVDTDHAFESHFKQQLAEDVMNYITRSKLPVKLSTATDHVADTYRVGADSAREWISMLVTDGACHIKSVSGTRILIPGPPPMDKKPDISTMTAAKSPNRQSWSKTDAEIAYRIVAALATSDKGPGGIVMHDIVNDIRGEYPSGRVVITIGKLLSQGFITTGEEPVRQRPHSKKQSPPNKTLRFRDDETYERVKANPEIMKLALKEIVR